MIQVLIVVPKIYTKHTKNERMKKEKITTHTDSCEKVTKEGEHKVKRLQKS